MNRSSENQTQKTLYKEEEYNEFSDHVSHDNEMKRSDSSFQISDISKSCKTR